MKDFYIKLVVAAVVIGGLFGFAWKQGLIERLATYFGETNEELKKCHWPSRDELFQYTALIFVAVAGLGLFTVVTDLGILKFVQALLKL